MNDEENKQDRALSTTEAAVDTKKKPAAAKKIHPQKNPDPAPTSAEVVNSSTATIIVELLDGTGLTLLPRQTVALSRVKQDHPYFKQLKTKRLIKIAAK